MIPPALATQFAALRAQADADTVPSGLLLWAGTASLPDGQETAPVLSQTAFEAAYGVLAQGALHADVLPSPLALKAPCQTVRADVAVLVALVWREAAVVQASFMTQLDAAAQAGTGLPEPVPALAEVITHKSVFFAGPLLHDQWAQALPSFRGLEVAFDFEPRCAVLPPGRSLATGDSARLNFDAGDGQGWRPVQIGDVLRVRYAGFGTVDCAVRVTVIGGSGSAALIKAEAETGTETEAAPATAADPADPTVHTRIAHFSLPLSAQPLGPPPDETWTLTAANGNTGTAWVYRAAGHDSVINPLIMAEGFPGGYAPDYLYDTLDQHGCATAWRQRGHDLVILGFGNGMDRIEANAEVAMACIEAAMARTRAPLVVGGVSMGGLVTRYALAAMEKQGRPHQTRMYLSIDTPHAGSHTALAVQWFAAYFAPASPSAALLAALLASPADQQFVSDVLLQGEAQGQHQGRVGTSPLRLEWLAALAEVGQYPQQLRRLAVACGAGDGVPVAAPGATMLEWQGSALAHARLCTVPAGGVPGTVASGANLWADGSVPAQLDAALPQPWEGAPGGQNAYDLIAGAIAESIASSLGLGTVQVPLPSLCTVPTVSALDLDTDPFAPVPPPGSGHSPFDDYTHCQTNQPHLQFTPAVRDWLVDRLGDLRPPPRKTMDATFDPTTFDPTKFDPHNPAFLADPGPVYAWFRQHQPVSRVTVSYQGQTLYDAWWVFRYSDVKAVLEDRVNFVKGLPGVPPSFTAFGAVDNFPKGIFSMDPPRHDTLRPLLDGLFKQAIADAPAVAAQIAAPLLKTAGAGTRVDLVGAYAMPLPSSVLMTVLGLPQGHWGVVEGWVGAILAANDFTASIPARVGGGTCAMAMGNYFQAMHQSGPGCPVAPMPARMLALMAGQIPPPGQPAAPPGMTGEELQQTSINLAVAGYLSTVFLIATGTYALLRAPAQLALLKAQPALMDNAMREMLRLESPVQVTDRVAATDMVLGGQHIKRGDRIGVVVGSANRDETVFPDAENLDITRDTSQHIGFGAGIHYCLGAPLASAVAPVAFKALLDAYPDIALDGDPQWMSDPYLRSVANLPVRLRL